MNKVACGFWSCLILTIGISARDQEPDLPSQELRDAVKANPNSLVGYTLAADDYGKLMHDTSLSERAMVLNLETRKSFEILPALRVVPRATSQFVGWLADHRTLMLQRGYFPDAILGVDVSKDNVDTWLDQYIVDLASRNFFVPTAVQTKGYQNGMMPYRTSTEAGYLLIVGAGPGMSKGYTMHFNGAGKIPFPSEGSNVFADHGCRTSPVGALAACELARCDGLKNACIQLFRYEHARCSSQICRTVYNRSGYMVPRWHKVRIYAWKRCQPGNPCTGRC